MPNVYFGDMNNDGRADAVAVVNEGAYVALSSGSAFGAGQLWGSGAAFGLLGTHLRHVTNDGRADLILVEPFSISVRINADRRSQLNVVQALPLERSPRRWGREMT